MSVTSKFLQRVADATFEIVLTAWVGGIWVLGYLVVPTLFYFLESRQQAGVIAGKLFEVSAWAGLLAGGYLLVFMWLRQGSRSLRTLAVWLVVLMVVLTAVSLFGIQPFMAQMKQDALPLDVMGSVFRERFATWHGISSGLYLLQSLLGVVLLLKAKPVAS